MCMVTSNLYTGYRIFYYIYSSRYLFIVIYDHIPRFILWGNWLDSSIKHLNSMNIGLQPIVSFDFCPSAHICIAGGLAWMLINLIPYVHWYNWLLVLHIQINEYSVEVWFQGKKDSARLHKCCGQFTLSATCAKYIISLVNSYIYYAAKPMKLTSYWVSGFQHSRERWNPSSIRQYSVNVVLVWIRDL